MAVAARAEGSRQRADFDSYGTLAESAKQYLVLLEVFPFIAAFHIVCE